jgi:glutamyl-tRNA synthetase/glutamyl-Q tRNA(Asp) synthetase
VTDDCRAIISRFAPAPTGYLHLGHAVNAVYVWRETRARGGRVLLRIEDHDRQRSRPEFEAAILEDLAWLGFEADAPPVRQSERGEVYEAALATLRRQGRIFACRCSRTDLTRRARGAAAPQVGDRSPAPDLPAGKWGEGGTGPEAEMSEVPYAGTCRDLGLDEGPGLGLRVKLDPTVERFVDLRHGPQAQRPSEQCGDLLVRDRDGNWTYQFAATVDDYVQEVTLVVRGDDLLASTGRQIQLARLLGRHEPPMFLHHPLIRTASGRKLSKAANDTSIRALREAGWTAGAVRERATTLSRQSQVASRQSSQ